MVGMYGEMLCYFNIFDQRHTQDIPISKTPTKRPEPLAHHLKKCHVEQT